MTYAGKLKEMVPVSYQYVSAGRTTGTKVDG